MHLDYLAIGLRWIHILSAATTIGGVMLIRFALLPAADALLDDARRKLHDGVRARWKLVVHAAIGLLLLSGFLNFFMYSLGMFPSGSPESKLYNALFGVKALLAFGVFGLAEVLVGSSPLAEKLRAKAKTWQTVNLVLLVLIVCLSGVMSRMHTTPNSGLTIVATETVAP
ncbi:MAG: hypothetical protein SGJ19_03080 [Planctomycetia bacterium]|nr:hypothetical protein [Planctomycetia bacterium]